MRLFPVKENRGWGSGEDEPERGNLILKKEIIILLDLVFRPEKLQVIILYYF